MKSSVLWVACAALAAACALSAPATAGITQAFVVKQTSYQQTGPSTLVPANGGMNASLTAIAVAQSPADFDSATVDYPGAGSPLSLTQLGGTLFLDLPPIQETPAALDADFPGGTYTFDAENSITLASQSVNVDYVNDFAFSAIPQFDAATFAALGTVKPGHDLTLHFNTFTPDPSARGAYTEILLTGAGAPGFFPLLPSSNHLTIPAPLIVAGATYGLTLMFDQQTSVTGIGSADEISDLISFTVPLAAVPEPGTWSLALIGLGLLGAALRRRAAAA